MSPVSRRRKPRSSTSRRHSGSGSPESLRLTHQDALDVLTRELVKLKGVTDAFVVEGVGTYLFDILDRRGPTPDGAFERFGRDAVTAVRERPSLLGLQAVALLRELGHVNVRGDAAQLLAGTDPELLGELPSWCAHLGAVHVVEAASLRTLDGRETVLHVLLDYDDAEAGSRHLLTLAIEHTERRVHLLDVRGREPDDSLAPMAERYTGSEEPVWSWVEPDELGPLVADAVRETARHTDSAWPVVDVDGGATAAWTLGVRRLERLTGLELGTRT
jgi:hypothetical protein